MSTIRILCVDDHPLLRDGIAALIAGQSDMQLSAEASTGVEAVERYRQSPPDITLLDIQMPLMDGIETLMAIRREFPDARVIALSEHHATIRFPDGVALPELGSTLRIAPNHVCAAVNLADELFVVQNDAVVDRWRVAARGANS